MKDTLTEVEEKYHASVADVIEAELVDPKTRKEIISQQETAKDPETQKEIDEIHEGSFMNETADAEVDQNLFLY